MKKVVEKYIEPGEWEVAISFDKHGDEQEWLGIVDARKRGRYKLTVVAHHSEIMTKGRITIRAVCGEESQVELKGIIRIDQRAQQTDDFLELRVLTLGPNARATAEPELEINANNVKASHAASVGKIDTEQLQYLQSRGLTLAAAQQIIIEGWLGV